MDTETQASRPTDRRPQRRAPGCRTERSRSVAQRRPGDWHIGIRVYYQLALEDMHFWLLWTHLVMSSASSIRVARSRATGQLVAMGRDGAHLVGVQSPRPYFDDPSQPARTIPITRVYSGDYDDVVRGKRRTACKPPST